MTLVFYGASVTAQAGNGVVAGLFLPRTDLAMVTAGEFASGEPQAKKESKALLGIGSTLLNYYSANSASILGFAISRTQTSVSDKVVNWAYNFTPQKVARSDSGTFDVLPLPSIGTNSGIGGIEIDTVFPNAVVVAAEGAIPSEGVLIPNSMILNTVDASLGVDARDYLEGLLLAVASTGGVTLRSASVASGIISVANPTAYAVFALPTAATDATNPTTDILAADLNKIATVQKTIGYTLQLLMNDLTGNFEINSVVS